MGGKSSKSYSLEQSSEKHAPQQQNEYNTPLSKETKEEINEIKEGIKNLNEKVKESIEHKNEEELKLHRETYKTLLSALQNMNKTKKYKKLYTDLGNIDHQISKTLAGILINKKEKQSSTNALNANEERIIEGSSGTDKKSIEVKVISKAKLIDEGLVEEENKDKMPQEESAMKEKEEKDHKNASKNVEDTIKKLRDEDAEEQAKIFQNINTINEIEENLKEIQKLINVFLGLPTDPDYLKLETEVEDMLKKVKAINSNCDSEDSKARQTKLLDNVKITLQQLRQRGYDVETIEDIEKSISKFEKQVQENIQRMNDYEKEDIEENLYEMEEKLERINVISELQDRRNICIERIHTLCKTLTTDF